MPSETEVGAKAPTKLQTFFKRLLSTVVLWAVLLGALFSGNKSIADLVLMIVLCVISVFGLMEFCDMSEKRGVMCFRRYAVVSGCVFVIVNWFGYTGRLLGELPQGPLLLTMASSGLIIVGLFVRRLFWEDMRHGFAAIGSTVLGLVYVPWLLVFLMGVYFHSATFGSWWLLYFILVTKSSDMGAYAIGSMMGKHKMIPRISPGKTWEGFGGAIAVSTGVSLVFAHFAQDKLIGITVVHAVILGIVLSVGAVVGDLIESLFKRESGMKDSGAYFPGIGGVLDLVDSLLFNAPIMFAYLVWLNATR